MLGSVDMLDREGMPQAVNVVGKAEQERLANLRGQAASGSARGEFAFDRRENAFDLGALAVRFFRKGAEHLIPNGAIGDTPAPRGNDALGSQALPNVLVVGFRVRLRIRQRLVLLHRATPAENVRRTRALDEPAAPTKSAAAHPLQSTTSTKGDEAWSRGNAAPGA